MQDDKFNIVFRGKLVAGFEESTVRTNLASLFKKDESRIAALFSGGRTILKRGLDRDTADKYRKAFRNAGAVVALVQDREQVEIKSESPPPPPAFGREVKAAYDGKASFQIDEGPPVPQGKAAFAVDESNEPESPPQPPSENSDEPTSTEDPFEALEMPGVAAPPAQTLDSVSAQDLPQQAEASDAAAAIDTSSLSLVDEIPVESSEGRASYVIDEGPTDLGGGSASFAIDDNEPSDPGELKDEPEQESVGDDFAPLEMPATDPGEQGSDASSATSAAGLAEPGSLLSKPVHVDPPDIDTSAFDISEIGSVVDETERPPPVQIDTGELATEADYEALDEAQPISAPEIDTGDMDVLEVGVPVDESERPPAFEIDTSGLSTDTDYEALEEAQRPAEPDIDISQLGLADD